MAKLPVPSTHDEKGPRDRSADLEPAGGMSDEVESLRGELLALKTIARRNEEEMEGLLRESLRLEDRNTRVHRQWLQVSQQLVDSESRARELEQSTSFRLGYAIASSLKSPSRLLALFPLLWKLV